MKSAQAHDARTGVIRWQQRLPGARNFTGKDTLAANRGVVFISGIDAQLHFFVHAYEAGTGTLLWEDRVSDPGQIGEVAGLALADDDEEDQRGLPAQLFASGVIGCDPATFLGCKLAVRAYDPWQGLLWQRADEARGGDWFAYTITAGAGRVYIGTGELLEDGAYHGSVRSYSAGDGAFKWAAPIDDGLGQPFSYVDGMAVREGGLVVTAQAFRADSYPDFMVRMYRPR